jgi:hypothetical protein
MSALVYEPRAGVGLAELEHELTRAFISIRAALTKGDAVVVCLDERDVEGVGDPTQAALAHGLLGLARAFAIEGRKAGWRIAVLSSTPDVEAADRSTWIEHLSDPAGALGTLIRLGGDHLGRVPT